MKKILLTAAIIASGLSVQIAHAQVRFNVNVNVGSQPAWGPVGYDHVENYYIPDIDAYYNVPAHQYVYLDNGQWVRTAYLPQRWANYDIYHGYKVVVNDRDPWMRDDVYRRRFAGYRGRRDQAIIGESHDERYRNHWDEGNHNGYDRGRGNPHGYSDHWHDGDRGRGQNDNGDRGRGHDDHGDRGDHGHDHGDH